MTERAARLQHAFEQIHCERMVDLPMVNPALQVAVIGFEACEHGYLGVLLTPWCMNLVLLPNGDEWQGLMPGSKQSHALPSGSYEFIVADELGLGRFQSCSLFSPMFEFADQATALATAEAALLAVNSEAAREQFGSGTAMGSVEQDETEAPAALSRRDFLRGKLRT